MSQLALNFFQVLDKLHDNAFGNFSKYRTSCMSICNFSVPFWEDGTCSRCSDKLEIIRPLWDLTCGYNHGCDLYYSGGSILTYAITVAIQYQQNQFVYCP